MAAIVSEMQEFLYLGNLEGQAGLGRCPGPHRGHLPDAAASPAAGLLHGTGESDSVREFCELAFGHVGLDWERFVRIDPRYLRPTEVDELRADPTQAREILGWRPRRSFRELVETMVESDLAALGLTLEQGRERASKLG